MCIYSHCVYWIHHEGSNIDEGYIGVTGDLTRRIWEHTTGRYSNNQILQEINQGAKIVPLFYGTKDACYELEASLRLKWRQGWNIKPGGYNVTPYPKGSSLPFKRKSRKGCKSTELTKQKLSVRRRGEGAGGVKLREPQVIDIKKRLLNKETLKDIAKVYGVDFTTISAIKRGKNWSHLTV